MAGSRSPQINVHVNFYGVLREITGRKSEEILLDSVSLEDLLKTLLRNYGKSFGGLFCRAEDFGLQVSIFINHVVVPSGKIRDIKLDHGDEIDLFVPVSGG
jgi:MoaD family protein